MPGILNALMMRSSAATTTIISQATGTQIGDMTSYGGLAAAFDGVTSTAQTSGCGKSISSSGYNNTVGKQWSSAKTISRFTFYAPNDNNILGAAGGTTVKLQGSNDGSAWTDLYTSGTVGTTGTTVDVTTGITTTTAYTYHRLNINGNGTNTVSIAELVFYELI